MIFRIKPVKLLIIFIGITAIINSCAWQDHIYSYYDKRPKWKVDRHDMIKVKDTIQTDTLHCIRTKYYSLDSLLINISCLCNDFLHYDTAFYKNGARFSTRFLIYGKSEYNIIYDKQNRPLWKTSELFYLDSANNYRQFYSKEGVLQPEKHPVVYEIL